MTTLCRLSRVLPLCCALALVPSSCRKLLDVPTPQDEISAGEVFSSDTNALNALTGLYIQIMNNSQSLLNGGLSLYGGLSSDELNNMVRNPLVTAFRADSLTATNPLCDNLYTTGYNLIYTANSLIAGVTGATGVSATMQSELRGEAEFVRALVYFYLVNLYGGVPLVTTTDFTVSSKLPRASVAAVYTQIVSDLQDAEKVLSATYISTTAYPGARTRPNQAAATALLARVWLYQGNWSQAEQEASTVIGNPLYRLEADPDSVFLATSSEAIWQLQPVYDTMATAEGNLFIPAAGRQPAYTLTGSLDSSWEPGDLRQSHWTDSTTGRGGTMVYYPYKYKHAGNTPPNAEYNMVLRLAEMYLIRAEARAEQGNTGQAVADLNTIRGRAGLAWTGATGVADLLAAIAHERRVELFAEWGHRWLDLKRTGQADAVLSAEKTGWSDSAVLYPIPASELTYNPQLVQNPGYH
jgi:starch-binding outer membrane protein, SusD/RagB family